MSNSNHIYSSPDHKTSVYEKMEDGKSFVIIHSEHDEVRISTKNFRAMVSAWNNKKWSEEWDTLDVTDRCFLVDSRGE